MFVDPKGITVAEYEKPCIQYTAYWLFGGDESHGSCVKEGRKEKGEGMNSDFGLHPLSFILHPLFQSWRRCWARLVDRGGLRGMRFATIFVARIEEEQAEMSNATDHEIQFDSYPRSSALISGSNHSAC